MFSLNARATVAIVLVAMSVAYAVLSASAATGLEGAASGVATDVGRPVFVHQREDRSPFSADLVPPGAVALSSAAEGNATIATLRPWPYGAQDLVPGPYARGSAGEAKALGLRLASVRSIAGVPGSWMLVPPAVFDSRFPALAGSATRVVSNDSAPIRGLHAEQTPAARVFYEEGAAQVYGGVHLVVVGTGIIVAILAAGVLRLEVLARERDLATLEAMAGSRLPRRLVIGRALFLSAAGVALGTAIGVGVTFAAGRAIGNGFSLRPGLVAEAALLAFLAGGLAGSLGGLVRLRAPLASRLGRRGPSARRFPGPLRFLFVTPRLFPGVFAAALVMTGLSGVVLAAAAVPYTVFEPQDGTTIIGQAHGNPFRGSASRFLAENAPVLPNITAASAETFAPTVVDGHPVMVRGVDFEAWRAVDAPTLAAGSWPRATGEASVGARLARVLHLRPGDSVDVPGAYRATLATLRVVAIHDSPGLVGDEVLTDLDTAGDLAGLRPDECHMIRFRGDPVAIRSAATSAVPYVLGLALNPPSPVPLTDATLHITLLNLDNATRSRTLNVRANGILVASVVAHVPASRRIVLDVPFEVPDSPSLVVQVNPTEQALTTPPGVRLLAPERVAQNETYVVRLVDANGSALAGARVSDDRSNATTNATGWASLRASALGRVRLLATAPGGAQAARVLYVVPRNQAHEPLLQVTAASILDTRELDASRLGEHLLVTLVNAGGSTYEGPLILRVDNETVRSGNVSLQPEARISIELDVAVPRDARVLGFPGFNLTLPDPKQTDLPKEQRAKTIAEILEEKQAEAARAARGNLNVGAFLQDIFAGLRPTLVVVVLATFVHAGAAVCLAVVRELREREENGEVLRSLGATPEQVGIRAMWDALVATAPPLLLGATLAWALLAILAPLGFPAAFGHTIPPSLDLLLVARIVGSLLLVAILTAYWVARGVRAAPAPRQVERRPVADVLEGAG